MHLCTCFCTGFNILPADLSGYYSLICFVYAHLVGTWQERLAGTPENYNYHYLFCLFRGIVGYMMEHEDVIKIPVNLKELHSKIKYAQTQLSQVSQGLNSKTL